MSLVPSLLQAIIRVDGEALVMHVGEKPYVVSPNGQVDLATRGLTFDAVNGIVGQLLPPDALKALEDVGAAQFDLPNLEDFPGEHFTVTAARGGDDVWAEIRRRQVPDEDLVPADIFTGVPVLPPEPEPVDNEDLALPKEEQLWPGARAAVVADAVIPPAAAADVDDDLRMPSLDEAGIAGPRLVVPVTDDAAPENPFASFETSAADEAVAQPPEAAIAREPEPLSVVPELQGVVPAPQVSVPAAQAAVPAPQAVPEPHVVVPEPQVVLPEPQVVLPEPPLVLQDVVAPASEAPVLEVDAEIPAPAPIVDPAAREAVVPEHEIGGAAAPSAEPEPEIVVSTPPAPSEPVHHDPEPAIEAPAVVRSWLESLSPADVWGRRELWSLRPQGKSAQPPEEPLEVDAHETSDPATQPVESVPAEPVVAYEAPVPVVSPNAHSLAESEVSAVPDSVPSIVLAAASERRAAEPVSEPVMATLPPNAPMPTDSSLSTPSQPAVVLPIARGGREMTAHTDQGHAALERLLRLAASRNASTLYLSSNARPSVRLDGDIQTLDGTALLTAEELDSMLAGAMPNAATGEWVWDLAEVGRVRCTSFRDHRGPGAVLRLVPVRAQSVSQLGLSREIQGLVSEPDGLVLVSGPRGNGKSTLLSSFVDLINRSRRDYVITIEQEINVVHERQGAFISQREVRGGSDEMLAAARAALREGPDVIVVDDLRSAALMSLVLDAASAGQLVIAGVPAHHATGAIDRLIALYQPEYRRQVQLQLAQNLRGVVNQVLLRKTGGGRVAAREVLLNTPLVASLLAEGRTEQLPVAIEGGRKVGMVPLNDALVGFVQGGAVDVPEAYRRASDRAGLLDLLKRQGIDTSFVERLA